MHTHTLSKERGAATSTRSGHSTKAARAAIALQHSLLSSCPWCPRHARCRSASVIHLLLSLACLSHSSASASPLSGLSDTSFFRSSFLFLPPLPPCFPALLSCPFFVVSLFWPLCFRAWWRPDEMFAHQVILLHQGTLVHATRSILHATRSVLHATRSVLQPRRTILLARPTILQPTRSMLQLRRSLLQLRPTMHRESEGNPTRACRAPGCMPCICMPYI